MQLCWSFAGFDPHGGVGLEGACAATTNTHENQQLKKGDWGWQCQVEELLFCHCNQAELGSTDPLPISAL